MKGVFVRLVVCSFAFAPLAAYSNEDDPLGGGTDDLPNEVKPRVVTKAGRKTLELLEDEKLASINLTPKSRYDVFKILKQELGKHGVAIRLKDYGDTKPVVTGAFELRDVPMRKVLDYLATWGKWGWILYPDGSITVFDSLCACGWPKDGIYCHDNQYKAGKPEVMAKEKPRPAAINKDAEQGGAGDR